MRTAGNVIWFIFTGLITSILWTVCGIFWCITIIGISNGLKAFKFAKLSLFPFGKTVETNFSKHPIKNVIWIIFSGFELAVLYIIIGCIWCLTLIGIPFGKQSFKFAKLALCPAGAEIKKIEQGV